MKNILIEQNRHWQDNFYESIPRDKLAKLISYLPLRQIITITGPSGCGKSTLLKQAINYLIKQNISPKNILFINLEHPYFLEYKNDINKEVIHALVQKKYYEKILLDKAYTIKLAQNDPLITQRLLKQMEFVMADKSANKEPSEKELLQYYQKNIQDYSTVDTLSFATVYFKNSSEKKLLDTFKLLTIAKVSAKNAQFFGEKSINNNQMKNITKDKAIKLYGRYFATKLFVAKQGIWHKAIRAKDGFYFIFITNKNVTKAENFDALQGRVYNEFLAERLRDIKKTAFDNIAIAYVLESGSIETP